METTVPSAKAWQYGRLVGLGLAVAFCLMAPTLTFLEYVYVDRTNNSSDDHALRGLPKADAALLSDQISHPSVQILQLPPSFSSP